MNPDKLCGTIRTGENEFQYCGAECVLIKVPEKLGPAQAVVYDIAALDWACNEIEKNNIKHPIIYILASRIGPFEARYVKRVHAAGGLIYHNPDGHEDWRRKWNILIRKYWKYSEKLAVKNADLVVCDSKSIEEYVQKEYKSYHPKTTFIAYGSHIVPSTLSDDDPKYVKWLRDHDLIDKNFYISVGRFVPENNFDIMIREFMLSHTKKDFAIITTKDNKYEHELLSKYHYDKDSRIKFVGTVYDTDLLNKIRANAYGYVHGHEVGGTNPSLLESLGATNLNLLYDVGFNREVAEGAALYWSKREGDLAALIDSADQMKCDQLKEMGSRAKARIEKEYSWKYIANEYERAFLDPSSLR